jgi:hypothetical protein
MLWIEHIESGISTVQGDNSLSRPGRAAPSRLSFRRPSPSGTELFSPRASNRDPGTTGGVLPVVTPVVGFKIGTGGCPDACGEP